jgi:hypothetical protein
LIKHDKARAFFVAGQSMFHSFVKAIWVVVDCPQSKSSETLRRQKNRTKSLEPKRHPFEKRHKTDALDESGENAEKKEKVKAGK